MQSNIFERLTFLSVLLTIVLLPLFCLPFIYIPVETAKGLLLVVGLTSGIIFWAITRFLDGKMILPKSWLLLSGFGVVFVYLLSALISGHSSQVSLFGIMLDVGSFWFIFGGFTLMLFSSLVFRTPRLAKIVLLGTIISSGIVLLFQSGHLFFPVGSSLGILADKTSNVLGSWNDLGLFAGFSCLMFLIVVEFFTISKIGKLILTIFIFLAIFLAAAVNFPLVWILLGISSLIIFVYKASITLQEKEEEGKKKYFPALSFIVVLISLLFFISGQFIGNVIPNSLNITNVEIRPSFWTTMSVTQEVLTKKPFLGIGPNRFGEAWNMYKPVLINSTQFWNVSFTSGSGLFSTLAATTGGLGILAWLVFFILFIITGIKSLFSSIKNKTHWEMMAFFVLSLYLFISSFFYSTGMVIFLLALSFTGVFIGLTTSSSNKEISISFINDHRKSFFSILFLVLIIILSATLLFKYAERFASVSYFGKAVSASTLPEAESFIGKALSLHSNDLYLRTYSQVYFQKINSIISKDVTSLSDTEKENLHANIEQMVSGAQLATAYNPKNYLNFQLLGSAFQMAALFGIEGANGQAVEAYKIASTLNPNNPELNLAMAGASFADGKIQDAKDYGNLALSLKPDYVDALLLLSHIAKSEENDADALSYAQTALSIFPTDEELIKYVDSIKKPSNTTTTAPLSTSEDPQ